VHFAGSERDWWNHLSPTNLDNFGARYYSSAMGRFMTPDWAAKPTAVPYANYGNPQSLNLYSYVENNPTTTADLDGHQQCTGGGSGNAEGHGVGAGCGPVQDLKNKTKGVISQAQQKNGQQQGGQTPKTGVVPLPPEANPAAQAAKYKAQRPVKPKGPEPPEETPNPTEPPPQIAPGQFHKGPMPETEPNPEYMTTGQRTLYIIMQVVRTMSRGENFILIVPRNGPPCMGRANACTYSGGA